MLISGSMDKKWYLEYGCDVPSKVATYMCFISLVRWDIIHLINYLWHTDLNCTC